jgi:hypothetical protein
MSTRAERHVINGAHEQRHCREWISAGAYSPEPVNRYAMEGTGARDHFGARCPFRSELVDRRYAFTARPGRKRRSATASQVAAAMRTGAERTRLGEHADPEQTAGATSLAERVSTGANSQELANGNDRSPRTDARP